MATSILQQSLFDIGSTPFNIPEKKQVFKVRELPKEQTQSLTNRALSQKDRVLEFLKARPNRKFTAPEIHCICAINGEEVASFRRALTVLKKAGLVTKLKERRTGHRGIDVSLWTVKL